ncbi:hypothetical protein CYQ88_10475 [Hydrogenovibrio sp. SC-1]|uniref:sensor histidine kinase n=1 Tax=Hydrogenovibrio sp. SC-1 TaxID=2065820 RepID=UPI000C7E7FBA|nr:ATP-binding protein [Hydrogenovibrio sp. SC-1]PLA73563.1 hypothetical protein CYQ88_10475 [Hydrogenovibrio sp. SC-1]
MTLNNQLKTKSLKKSLFLSTFLVLILTFGLIIAWAYQDSVHEVNELFDAQLASQNHLIQNLIESRRLNPTQDDSIPLRLPTDTTRLHEYESKLLYQLLGPSGNILISSFDNNLFKVISLGNGYHNIELETHQWRILIDQVDPNHTLIVGQQLNIRNELIEHIAINLIFHFLIALPILAGLFIYLLNRHLNQLNLFSRSLSGIQPYQRHRLRDQQVPVEVAPLVIEIEQLLNRAEKMIEAEREFISSAAHELKTPFSAMRLQLENLQTQLKSTSDLDRTAPYLDSLFLTLDRSEYLISQLLTLQKMQPEVMFDDPKPVNLHQLTHQVVESLAQSLIDKNQTLDYKTANISFKSNPLALQIILSNLIGNAIRYTPDNGTIQIYWRSTDANIILSVEDSGPGIPEPLRDKVFQRFYRQNAHRQISQGCGLGLSIVQKAAQSLGAEIQLSTSSKLKGLKVIITFPRTPHATSSPSISKAL